MTILSAKDLHRSIGVREILTGASLNLDAGERTGLVGRNGCGKSTFAKILAGIDSPDSGEVVVAKGARVLLLEQDPQYPAGTTAIEAVLAGKIEWSAAIERHRELSETLAALDTTDPEYHKRQDSLLRQQAAAAARVEDQGGWDLRHQAQAMLAHLGIGLEDHDRPVDRMSGGQRRRVALARLFVAQPDVAILDEPTNHLDLAAIEWLEQHLVSEFRGAMLLITHDRELLDQVVTRTLEIEQGKLYSYEGGWGSYLEAKAQRQAHAARTESNRQNYLRREVEWLRRQPKARTTKSKSRVDAVEAALAINAPQAEKTAGLALESSRSGKTVLDIEGLAVERDGRRLLENLDLYMTKSQRLGVLGPNGCGKSSFLACLLGELEPAAGTMRLGKNVDIAYLDQARSGLKADATVYDMVAEGRTQIELGGQKLSVRQYLERMLFDVHAQRQRISSLSGGERGRVALARVLREPANLVILDEPTNDLDVDTLSALEGALGEFGGTLITVTHDRWFLDRVMTHLLVFEGQGQVHVHTGNYTSYREFRARHPRAAEAAPSPAPKTVELPAEPAATPAPATPRPELTFTERHELDGMMPKIEAAESRLAELEAALQDSDFYQRPAAEQRAHHADLAATREEVDTLVARWEQLEARA